MSSQSGMAQGQQEVKAHRIWLHVDVGKLITPHITAVLSTSASLKASPSLTYKCAIIWIVSAYQVFPYVHQWFFHGRKQRKLPSKQIKSRSTMNNTQPLMLRKTSTTYKLKSWRITAPISGNLANDPGPECSGPIPPLVSLTPHSGTLVLKTRRDLSFLWHVPPSSKWCPPLTQVFPSIRITHHMSKEQTLLTVIASFTPHRCHTCNSHPEAGCILDNFPISDRAINRNKERLLYTCRIQQNLCCWPFLFCSASVISDGNITGL